MKIGNTLQKIRKEKGIKQKHFAQECNISATYLSQIENNVKDPNLKTLNIIAEKLEIPIQILFFLSLEETDVKEEKREAYKMISEPIKMMVNEFFVGYGKKSE